MVFTVVQVSIKYCDNSKLFVLYERKFLRQLGRKWSLLLLNIFWNQGDNQYTQCICPSVKHSANYKLSNVEYHKNTISIIIIMTIKQRTTKLTIVCYRLVYLLVVIQLHQI